jgi:L-fucose isomerase-like protein
MRKLRVGYACLARLSFDGEYAEVLRQRSIGCLSALDIELVHRSGLTVSEEDGRSLADHFTQAGVDVVVVQYGTFALGSLLPLIAQHLPAPIVLWGAPEPSFGGGKLRSNSLCGINMNAHALMRLGRPYDYVFRAPEEAGPELQRIFRVVDCIRRLREVRLGLVGYRVPGFYSSSCDEFELRKKLGVEVHHVTLNEVWDAARAAGSEARAREIAAIRAGATSIQVGEGELDKAAALYVGFQTVVERYGLGALAVKCWPEFADGYGIAACSSMGRLNQEGVLTSCEGDVYGAVTMLIEHYLSGGTPMFADFVAIDEEANTGLGWHCGAAPVNLAAKDAVVEIGLHPTVGGGGKKGVAGAFQLRDEGPVTMARLGVGPNGLRLFFAAGEAARTGKILCGNTLAVRFSMPVRQLLDLIMREGVEHHFAMVHADLRDDLRALARWLQLPAVDANGVLAAGAASGGIR